MLVLAENDAVGFSACYQLVEEKKKKKVLCFHFAP